VFVGWLGLPPFDPSVAAAWRIVAAASLDWNGGFSRRERDGTLQPSGRHKDGDKLSPATCSRFELEAKPEPYRSKRKADASWRRYDGDIGGNWKWVEDLDAYSGLAIGIDRTRISCRARSCHRTACGFPWRKPHKIALGECRVQEIRGSQRPFRAFPRRKPSRSLSGHSNCETALAGPKTDGLSRLFR
jgi:hypothetical protein